MYSTLIHWLNAHMLPCLFKSITGFDCPGCGIQRAIIDLMKGHISESIHQYPPLPFIMILVFVTFITQRLDFKYRLTLIYTSYFLALSSIVINFLIKLF